MTCSIFRTEGINDPAFVLCILVAVQPRKNCNWRSILMHGKQVFLVVAVAHVAGCDYDLLIADPSGRCWLSVSVPRVSCRNAKDDYFQGAWKHVYPNSPIYIRDMSLSQHGLWYTLGQNWCITLKKLSFILNSILKLIFSFVNLFCVHLFVFAGVGIKPRC